MTEPQNRFEPDLTTQASDMDAETRSPSGLAIASLVCSVLAACFFPLAIVGIVLGTVAISKAKRQPPPGAGKGLAIAGIAVGCGMLVVGGVAMVVLVTGLGRARIAAQYAVDMSNLGQITLAQHAYAADAGGYFPPHVGMLLSDDQQYISSDVFLSPANSGRTPPTWNGQFTDGNRYRFGDYVFIRYEGELANTDHMDRSDADSILAYGFPMTPEDDMRNVSFVDGSAFRMSNLEFTQRFGFDPTDVPDEQLQTIDIPDGGVIDMPEDTIDH